MASISTLPSLYPPHTNQHATIRPSVVIVDPHSFLPTPAFLGTAMMALRAVAAARPPPPPHTLSSAPKLSLPPPKTPVLKPTIFHSVSTAAPPALSLLLFFSSSADAKALSFSKEQIVSSLTEVENAINQAVGVGSDVLKFSKGVLQTLFDVLKPGIDVALPIIQKAGGKAVEITSPAISGAADKAQESLQNAGFDPQPVVSVAKSIVGAAPGVIEKAKPVASTTIETLLSSDPQTIAVAGGALFLSYLLLPPIWSVISFNLRGYQGDLSPAQALDMISSRNYLIIDIRSEKEKNKAGIPRVPNNVRNKIISIPLEEIPSKVKNLVRNVKKVEAEIVALKIAYLKRVNKGSNLVIMDSYADTAKIVAKTLTSLGFQNCWIMAGGFSGGRGWTQSRLGADSYNVSLVEVVSPSRVIPPTVGRFGTTSSRKLLPGGFVDD